MSLITEKQKFTLDVKGLKKLVQGLTSEKFISLVGKEYDFDISMIRRDPEKKGNLFFEGRYWYSTGHSRSGIDDAAFKGYFDKTTMTGWVKTA